MLSNKIKVTPSQKRLGTTGLQTKIVLAASLNLNMLECCQPAAARLVVNQVHNRFKHMNESTFFTIY